MDNYVIRLASKDAIKDFNVKKFCKKCRAATAHKAKEVKGGY